MKAWRIETHGGVEALQYKEIPSPVLGAGQARIRVKAVGLNHLDLWVRKGVPGHKFPLPITPGCDISGVIEEVGPITDAQSRSLESMGLKHGSAVVLQPGVSCGQCSACLSGFDPLCVSYGILGESCDGGCADEIVVPLENLIPLPRGMTHEEGAAVPIPFLTAWTMLFRKAEIRPGDLVLVHAGGSGVSVAAIQMAKMIGCLVATTVGSPEKVAHAKSLGADVVIEYKKEPFAPVVKKWAKSLGKRGMDVVVDHVGAETFTESMKSLAWGGKIVTCGATSGSEVTLDLKAVFFKNIEILGTTMGSKADLLRIFELLAQKKLRAVVGQVLPMQKLPEAHRLLDERKVFGKMIVSQSS